MKCQVGVGGSATRSVFFFFQAEDGIRDLTVTGVQTCALPISPAVNHRPSVRYNINTAGFPYEAAAAVLNRTHSRSRHSCVGYGCCFSPFPKRSEERRVGKEGKSRWAPDP